MAFQCPAGTQAQTDGQGNILYCYDDAGNVSYPPTDPTLTNPSTAPSAPAGSGTPSPLVDFTTVENGLLTAWRTVTAPQVAPGSVGGSLTLGTAGAVLQGSPVLILAALAALYIIFRK